jgi:hypothetical protein
MCTSSTAVASRTRHRPSRSSPSAAKAAPCGTRARLRPPRRRCRRRRQRNWWSMRASPRHLSSCGCPMAGAPSRPLHVPPPVSLACLFPARANPLTRVRHVVVPQSQSHQGQPVAHGAAASQPRCHADPGCRFLPWRRLPTQKAHRHGPNPRGGRPTQRDHRAKLELADVPSCRVWVRKVA